MQYNHGVVDRSGNKKLMFFYFSFQEKKIITLSNEIKLQFSPAVVKIWISKQITKQPNQKTLLSA